MASEGVALCKYSPAESYIMEPQNHWVRVSTGLSSQVPCWFAGGYWILPVEYTVHWGRGKSMGWLGIHCSFWPCTTTVVHLIKTFLVSASRIIPAGPGRKGNKLKPFAGIVPALILSVRGFIQDQNNNPKVTGHMPNKTLQSKACQSQQKRTSFINQSTIC